MWNERLDSLIIWYVDKYTYRLRDGPLEKLWGKGGGGGEFSSGRSFFSLTNSLYEFFLGQSMNIFED